MSLLVLQSSSGLLNAQETKRRPLALTGMRVLCGRYSNHWGDDAMGEREGEAAGLGNRWTGGVLPIIRALQPLVN